MNPSGADKYTIWAAVHVLGSLIPAEQREYELHLAECAQCAAIVSEFAGLPELLAVLESEQAQALVTRGKASIRHRN
ncbi:MULTISPECIES: hypothetical protein [unclassified Paenarthrobacter]|uniref:hypothetical protein n=1 Tax=unclassified Paenarthrobacter TaxID=2634190 RepID=UPI00084E8668|nr:hypothetical protein [Paenarthrobacter sp. R1]NKR10631.1 hypothetical protein [Arthrobacter sp. M5]NKR16472.1 hypothetical protein [Arthrobacter sp. M6]OEH61419.1 hypothetical protein A5N13_16880 [Arthrobacter sp. D4]OEH64405.1 hypothetical protein A5N17_06275 [Arthrobacter sp. D2]WIV29186.1 hypothetical protein QN084_12440 [Paenarthrobacter sp. R1]